MHLRKRVLPVILTVFLIVPALIAHGWAKNAAEPPLPPEFMEHIYVISQKYDLLPQDLLAIIHHESRGIADVRDNVNTNGTSDRGLCQINQINWGWLKEDYGLDVSDPFENIECAAVILSIHTAKYPRYESLAAYAAGAGGMLKGKGFWFADKIVAKSAEYAHFFEPIAAEFKNAESSEPKTDREVETDGAEIQESHVNSHLSNNQAIRSSGDVSAESKTDSFKDFRSSANG